MNAGISPRRRRASRESSLCSPRLCGESYKKKNNSQVSSGIVQRIDFKFSQLRHDALGEKRERVQRLFLRQLAEGEFAEEGVGAGVDGDFLDLLHDGFRRAADKRAFGDGMLH